MPLLNEMVSYVNDEKKYCRNNRFLKLAPLNCIRNRTLNIGNSLTFGVDYLVAAYQ
jgi:hypothetical protein